MSDRPHDSERDDALTALYRDHVRGVEPPVEVDDAIRAAARRSVGAGPQRSTLKRSWHLPLSIAAVLVLSVSLVTLMREEAPELVQPQDAGVAGPEESSRPRQAQSATDTAREAPAVAERLETQPREPRNVAQGDAREGRRPDPSRAKNAAPSSAAVQAFPGSAPATEAASGARGLASAEGRQTPPLRSEPSVTAPASKVASAPISEGDAQPDKNSRARVAPAPASPPATAAVPPKANAEVAPQAVAKAEGGVATGQLGAATPANRASDSMARDRSSPGVAALPAPRRPTASEKAMARPSEQFLAFAGLPPDQWLQRIEEMRKQGNIEQARANLAEFRRRHPDYPLTEALKGILEQ